MVVAFRWVDNDLNVHEDFIGLYARSDITATTIVSAIQDTLARLNLALNKVRGQCYDGASTMRSLPNGVAKQTQDAERMLSIIQNYTVLNELWDKACNVVGDTETIAGIRGAAAQMASFEFFLGLLWVRCFYTIPTNSVTMCQLMKVKP